MLDNFFVHRKKYKMLKYALNICLISFFVIHLVNAGDAAKQNRRVKRLGANSRNGSQKFKKGEKFLVIIFKSFCFK